MGVGRHTDGDVLHGGVHSMHVVVVTTGDGCGYLTAKRRRILQTLAALFGSMFGVTSQSSADSC